MQERSSYYVNITIKILTNCEPEVVFQLCTYKIQNCLCVVFFFMSSFDNRSCPLRALWSFFLSIHQLFPVLYSLNSSKNKKKDFILWLSFSAVSTSVLIRKLLTGMGREKMIKWVSMTTLSQQSFNKSKHD